MLNKVHFWFKVMNLITSDLITSQIKQYLFIMY